MKNKKLFAILTLVCFMMTLMPVAAFAATYGDIAEDSLAVKTGEKVELSVNANGNYYVYAVKNDALAGVKHHTAPATTTGSAIGISVVKANITDYANQTIDVQFTKAGEYTVGIAEANTALDQVIDGTNGLVAPATVLAYLDTFAIDMLSNKVSVSQATVAYKMTLTLSDTVVDATNGFDKAYNTVKLTTMSDTAIPGADLEIVTDSYAINVVKIDSKTRVDGTMRFYVTGSIPGTYNVYVDHPFVDEANDVELAITVSPATVDEVVTLEQPTAPQDYTSADTTNVGMLFELKDSTGYAYTNLDTLTENTDYKVSVLEAPKGFDKTQDWGLQYNTTDKGWEIVKDITTTPVAAALDQEGSYTFQVALANGSKAVASVDTARFDKAVALKFVKAPVTVQYNNGTQIDPTTKVFEVDAKGVVRVATGVTLSANGKAIATFNSTTGALTTQVSEKFIGSKITVIATKGNLVATHELTVTDNASAIVYANTTASVGANAVLTGRVFDADGKFVAIPTGTATVYVIEKPENAIVSAAPVAVTNGVFDINFLASVAGEYKIQTVVTFGTSYVSDMATITVGAAEGSFKDVIVLSIGSNNMIKNGDVASLLAAPEIKDGRTMIPMRAGLEAFGATVNWNEADRTVTAEMNGVTVVMTVDSLDYTVNGKAMKADSAPYIKNGSTMVPAVFFTNAFGIVATPLYDANGVCDVLFSK